MVFKVFAIESFASFNFEKDWVSVSTMLMVKFVGENSASNNGIKNAATLSKFSQYFFVSMLFIKWGTEACQINKISISIPYIKPFWTYKLEIVQIWSVFHQLSMDSSIYFI